MNGGGLREAKLRHRAISYRWGFMWALWAAILWAAWYLPGGAMWYEKPFSELPGSVDFFLAAAIVLTALNAVAVLLFMFIWLAVAKKLGEFWLTLKQFRKISYWYFLAAILGGLLGFCGSYIAMGYVGPVFSVIAALMYPVVGAIAARLWYKERITRRCALGIAVIIAGGLFLYAPGILAELTGSGASKWVGYLGGLMSAIGWGVEGAVAGRALDVTEPDVGLTIRFTAEPLYWFAIILPLLAWRKYPVWDMVGQSLSNGWMIVWLVLAGITFAWEYVCWYKSFPLVGVGRGQAIADLAGLFTIIFTVICTLKLPNWNFFVAAALAIGGAFIMYTEGSKVLDVVRDTAGTPSR